MKRKLLSLILCLALLLSGIQVLPATALADTVETTTMVEPLPAESGTDVSNLEEPSDVAEENEAPAMAQLPSTAEPVLAYVPLDNRPVNVDRVIYEAEAAGFNVIMPDEDLYATRLDGQPFNSNGTQYGDSQKLLEWILAMDRTTDYFVISLDQLLSGGLVNSRVLNNLTYLNEYEIIDKIIELSKNNHVYIIDTVARLATCTVGYKGATLDTYNYLRQYNATPRNLLTGENLKIKNIVDGYKLDEKGVLIATSSTYSTTVKNSLRTRERKLRLLDYLLNKDVSGEMEYFIGIDDSNSQNTIQTNEVNYIREVMDDRGFIYSGTDELGMMAVLRLMLEHYASNVNATAIYFGNTEDSSAGSIYDMETVKENVEEHLKSIGVMLVGPEQADLEILVLTLPARSTLNSKYIDAIIDHINSNILRGTPTIVINSAPNAYSNNFEYRMVRECEMSMLLAYSSWGTVGNSIGLALGNGISRYLYLHSRSSSSNTSDIAFLKGLIFSYEKDISYLRGGGQTLFDEYITSKGWTPSNFYKNENQMQEVYHALENILRTSEYNVTVDDILDNLTDCRYLKGLGGECGIIGNIDITGYEAPFFRTNEMRFDINVKISNATINLFNNAMTISIPYSPPTGRLIYSLSLYGRDKSGKLHKIPSTYDKSLGLVKFSAVNQYSSFFVDTLSMDAEQAYALFTDANPSAWYFDYILYVYEKGLMKGVGNSTFQPNASMTRAMLVNTLYNMAGKPEAVSEGGMPDIAEGSWYEPAVKWALANKIVSGYDNGTFGPNDQITREQLAVLLWRYANYAGLKITTGSYPRLASYSDGFSVYESMRMGFDWVCSNGIMNGTVKNGNTILCPQTSATRAEVAAVLKRFVDMGISLPDNKNENQI